MNITALRPRLIQYLTPVARLFFRAGLTPNQISVLSLICGLGCAYLFYLRNFPLGSLFLVLSAILDLIDGSVARMGKRETNFGAVFDWITDKYIDTVALIGIGFSGIPILSRLWDVPPLFDFGIVAIAITGSMMNTFIKPVVYAEIGFKERVEGKIEDPLEGVGFFGRPETILALVLGGLTGLIWLAVILIAICTHLSALERIIYLYRRIG
jgi:archaetidylinositol phosphate synthase